MKHLFLLIFMLAGIWLLVACASPAPDPFAYCAKVGTVDAPDASWTGPKTPDAIVRGLMKAMELPADAPLDPIARSTFWRCMDKKVYACSVGANIPCQERADTSQTPGAALNEFCQANPASDFIPAYITGRATVYEWKCADGAPVISRQLTEPDGRGFLKMFWYEIRK